MAGNDSDVKEEVMDSGLVYTNDMQPGYYRHGEPGKFYYTDKGGNKIKGEKLLDRFKKLVIPPAWQQVWIAKSARAYLQVTGKDVKGRKQYRYHPDWTKRRTDAKYFKLYDFGKALPAARKVLEKDLRRKKLDETKVLAVCVDLMQKSLIRIGNESYKVQNGSFGLSTLRDKHAEIKGDKINLRFVGKKGVKQDVKISDRRLATLVKKCREIPGQELFQYYDDEGKRHSVDSAKINAYIKSITGGDFTAKDFRTWGATLEALRQMALCYYNKDERPRKKLLLEVLDCVACKLGNTRAVCKSSYVYPLLMEAYEYNELDGYLKKMARSIRSEKHSNDADERILMQFLNSTLVQH